LFLEFVVVHQYENKFLFILLIKLLLIFVFLKCKSYYFNFRTYFNSWWVCTC